MATRKNIGITIAAGLVFGAFGCVDKAAGATGEQWPTYQGDSGHTGFVDVYLAPNVGTTVRWRNDSAGSVNGFSGVAVGQGRVFATPNTYFNGQAPLISWNLNLGTENWRVDFGSVFSVNPPALDGEGGIYLVTGNHGSDTYLRAYDADDGGFRWRTALSAQWERYLAPTIIGDDIATNCGYYGGIASVHKSGKLQFFTGLPQYADWTPTPWRKTWVALTSRLDVVDRSTGAAQFSVAIPNYSWTGYSVRQVPIVVNDIAYFTNGGRLLGVDLITKSVIVDRAVNATGQVTSDGNSLFVISNGTLSVRNLLGVQLYAIEFAQGAFTPPIIVTKSHAIVNAGSNSSSPDRVAIIDLKTRSVQRTIAATGQIALAEDSLIIATTSGALVALDAPMVLFADGLED